MTRYIDYHFIFMNCSLLSLGCFKISKISFTMFINIAVPEFSGCFFQYKEPKKNNFLNMPV